MPDMKIPIQYALTYPERTAARHARIDLPALGQMTFFPPDLNRFPCLALAYSALRAGGTAPAVLNAANEMAVELFLEERIPFDAIPAFIEDALAAHEPSPNAVLDDLVYADRQAREYVLRHAASHAL
jgi:1-deoxy-D-xylulose-5-phosphate reductoisomerase